MSSKVNIFLDLDETLIFSVDLKKDVELKKDKKKEQELKKLDFHLMKDEDGNVLYVVYHRPNIQEFLTFLFENFTVSVWTAASKDYALDIVDNVIHKNKKNKLDFILYHHHDKFSQKHNKSDKKGNKVMAVLDTHWKLPELAKGFIIDDNDYVRDAQPKNCIVAPSFDVIKGDMTQDKFLTNLIPKMKELKVDSDVSNWAVKQF